MPSTSSKPKSSDLSFSLDFSGTEDREGGAPGARVPEGDYLLKLKSASKVENKDKKGFHIRWVWTIAKPEAHKGKTIYQRTSLREDLLWGVRNLLRDLLGKEIPKKLVNINLPNYAGKMIAATIGDGDPFGDNNKINSEVQATYPASEYDSDAEAEDSDEDEATEAIESGDDEDEEELETVDDDL